MAGQDATAVPGDLAPVLVRFAERLRDAGVAASPDRVHAFLAALDAIGAGDPADVYWTGRVTLCGDPLDLLRYDRIFAEVFGGAAPDEAPVRRTVVRVGPAGDDDEGDEGEEVDRGAGRQRLAGRAPAATSPI